MTDAKPAAQAADAPRFSLGKLYLKDASLEAPNSPAAFIDSSDWDPKVTLEWNIRTTKLSEEDTYEVTLMLTVTAAESERTLFLIEIKQGGLFLISKISKPEYLNRLLEVRCARILFPYAREALDNLVVKAGFPPLMIGPIDFKAAFEQKVADGGKA